MDRLDGKMDIWEDGWIQFLKDASQFCFMHSLFIYNAAVDVCSTFSVI